MHAFPFYIILFSLQPNLFCPYGFFPYLLYLVHLFIFLFEHTQYKRILDNDLLEKTQTFSKTEKYMKQKEEMTIDFFKKN